MNRPSAPPYIMFRDMPDKKALENSEPRSQCDPLVDQSPDQGARKLSRISFAVVMTGVSIKALRHSLDFLRSSPLS